MKTVASWVFSMLLGYVLFFMALIISFAITIFLFKYCFYWLAIVLFAILQPFIVKFFSKITNILNKIRLQPMSLIVTLFVLILFTCIVEIPNYKNFKNNSEMPTWGSIILLTNFAVEALKLIVKIRNNSNNKGLNLNSPI